MSFGTKLQELRKEKGMTQEELANDLAITPQSVSKWENEQSTPDLDTLVKIAKILGVSCDYLLGNEVEAKVTVVFYPIIKYRQHGIRGYIMI